ncbi:primosomal replication priB and priC family protein [Yersinia pseudotuberculosis IP 32953]|uniref:Prephenate dehydrogenase n=2 Tax=Yersinia pseudotuberculosis TaxID=633 RepID=A0ABM7ACG2_YERPU|nr:primosomal replication protein PriC [Yersinia pseudotuberculosis]CQD51759.1 primosomal replication protein n'' [Yersinia intermedia]AJJ04617.1 primosomal replication priB and priC family protein [Yersinia pseudotuberculosis]AJJ55939.1 primosomal replication priB and priC family protein [Yersinia pseudotuberculosis IP 32953]AJJ68835.1 primosomal replication priB and priC family protein [Yersinia pseudotuberculosis PB1/+]AYW90090.1 prephenate dehydrogenase [Yersinia pseudotuberculosis]
MSTEKLLQVLESQIEALSAQIAPQANTPSQQARFDLNLFSNHGNRFRDYLQEVRKNMTQLKQVVEENRLQQVAFLADKLVAQISALQRELATQKIRKSNPEPRDHQSDPYHKLAEHQDYERRILAMIQDRESQLGQQSLLVEQQKIQKELAALEGRLMRCRQALIRIERSIEKKENGF